MPRRPFGYHFVKGLVRLAERIGEFFLGPEPKRDPLSQLRDRAR
jgi:hypothetical protein